MTEGAPTQSVKLAGVGVEVPALGLATTTGSDGTFTLPDLVGEVEVSFSHPDYVRRMVNPDKGRAIAVALLPNFQLVETVLERPEGKPPVAFALHHSGLVKLTDIRFTYWFEPWDGCSVEVWNEDGVVTGDWLYAGHTTEVSMAVEGGHVISVRVPRCYGSKLGSVLLSHPN